ncbi:extracellular solute-binding protein [Modestobacter versicolor]|uniref:ABC transporter substrate-binding protein n=1 Tax=Modestobacter versicolor TaxID=429133 RepID=A0A323V7J5_9ACTN|nr:extracellular solute-binding protein [Modestobacter versicolor]MBB3678336.1 multiple sugar transport system substrate-binding protein [Modestobacter versicolor]PZA20732.1 ABC transporter substrate-binding protein [Modestobacter versicolor]
MLAACGSDEGGVPTLTWYINPDAGGQAEIASRCTEAAEGRYRIATATLPREATGQREQLIRRLAANDASIDIMSLDPPFIPEFAQAGFLAPVPEDVAERVTEDVVESAIEGSTWDDELVAVPFWANTQILWYRESVAEAAGLDMSQPVTWDEIIAAAQDQDALIGVQGIRAEALTVWFNALIESAGGSIIAENSTDPEQIQLGLTSEAGVRATEVMRAISDSGQTGPALSTANEDSTATGFEGEDGGFMVNYPFVYPRALGKVEEGSMEQATVDDYGWAVYPQVDEGTESAPPYGGINLGVGAFSENVDFAFEATECITSTENQAYYFVTNGNPASDTAVYDDPAVLEEFPMAPVIQQSLEQAAPRPQTPYYSEVSGGLQREYHPTGSVDPESTPESATDFITAVLRKEQLL